MTPAEFTSVYEETLFAIEEAIEALDGDIDFETVNQILTIICPDGSRIIVTPQSATGQLWIAARSGGFHFAHDGEQWLRTTDNLPLDRVMDSLFQEQAGMSLGL